MRRLEARFWSRMSVRLRRAGAWAERVENVVAEGTPDVHICTRDAGAAWLELKAVAAWPAKSTTAVLASASPLRPAQKAWHTAYAAAGGRSYIAVSVGVRDVFLLHGADALRINEWTRAQFEASAAAAGWHAVLRVLGASNNGRN